MDRTNSMGLWSYANSFYMASCELVESKNQQVIDPIYYLVSHSIELSLKAFLRGNGISLEDLKNYNKIGHDLEKMLAKSMALGLETYIELTESDHLVINMINHYYKNKELEYIVTGTKSYPHIESLLQLNERILNSIRLFCFHSMKCNVV